MAGTNQANVLEARRKDLLKGMALWDSDMSPSEGDQLVADIVNDTQGYIKIAHFTRPVGPQPVSERQLLPEGQYNQVRTATFTNQAYGMILSFSKEVWRDNQYADVLMQNYGTDLRDLCHDVRDIALVNEFFNLAWTNTGPDGKTYIATDHALDAEAAELTDDNTATHSNEVTGNPGVATAALNLASNQLKRERDNKGRIKGVMPPFVLECSSIREILWRQISSPVNGFEPFTADNNSGKGYAGLISKVIGLTRATHDDYWILRTANKRKFHRFVWDRQGVEVSKMQEIIRDRTLECSVDFRLSKGEFDWRGKVGSQAGA